MILSYYYEIQDLNWSAVVELPSRLRRFNLETTSVQTAGNGVRPEY